MDSRGLLSNIGARLMENMIKRDKANIDIGFLSANMDAQDGSWWEEDNMRRGGKKMDK